MLLYISECTTTQNKKLADIPLVGINSYTNATSKG
jgi:hypothetical protein